MVMACSSCRTVAASAKSTPCFLRFAAAFRGSHSPSSAIDPQCMHKCAYCQPRALYRPATYSGESCATVDAGDIRIDTVQQAFREALVGARGFEPPTPRSRTECTGATFLNI